MDDDVTEVERLREENRMLKRLLARATQEADQQKAYWDEKRRLDQEARDRADRDRTEYLFNRDAWMARHTKENPHAE